MTQETSSLQQVQAWLAPQQEAWANDVRAAWREHILARRLPLSPQAGDEISAAVLADWQRFLATSELAATRDLGAHLAQQGLGLAAATAVLAALRRTGAEFVPAAGENERALLLGLLDAADGYAAAFLEGWMAAHEQTIREEQAQWRHTLDAALAEKESRLQRTISELSSPVIQVWEGVLVMPLVGVIDSGRARRMTEDLLNGIVTYQAEQVIIDITGVPVVDTGVANHLLQTIKAARLLGARCLLVGISSEVAQAMVHLGIDLSGVVTRANLQAGIEYVLAQMGLGVAPLASGT